VNLMPAHHEQFDRDGYRTVWGPRVEQEYENAMDKVEAGRLDPYLAPFGWKESPELVMETFNAYRCQCQLR
jgi:hypothetical protein